LREFHLFASNIRDIPVATLSQQGKVAALQWLHTTLTNYSHSYRVSEACLDMIAEIGFATLDDATVQKFVALTARCLAGKWGTVVSALTAEEHIKTLDAVISKLDTLSELSSDGLEWLLHQSELSAAQFATIRAKLGARLSNSGRMDHIAAVRILRNVNEPLVLNMAGAEWQGQPIQCFALLELVTSNSAQHADALFRSLANRTQTS